MTDHSGNKLNSHACLLEFCEFVLKSMLMKYEFCLRAQLIVTSFIARFLKSAENNTSSLHRLKFSDGTLFPSVSYAYMLLKSDERRQRSFFSTTASHLMFRAVIDKFSQKSTIYIYGCWIKMFYLIRYVRSL